MIIVANGHALNVTLDGPADGPAVVLLHHGLGAASAWMEQIPALVAANWRVVSYDRWGYGASAPRPSLDIPGFSQDQDDLRVVLDELRIDKAALVGHSDGGTIALGWAARWPERVTHLVLVAAHIYLEPLMEPQIEATRQAFDRKENFWNALVQVHGAQAEQVISNWYRGWTHIKNAGWDMRPQLSQIRCPVLVMQGLQDEHATPQHARDLAAALSNAHLLLLPDTAHMLPQDAPEIFNAHLLAFLAQTASVNAVEP